MLVYLEVRWCVILGIHWANVFIMVRICLKWAFIDNCAPSSSLLTPYYKIKTCHSSSKTIPKPYLSSDYEKFRTEAKKFQKFRIAKKVQSCPINLKNGSKTDGLILKLVKRSQKHKSGMHSLHFSNHLINLDFW